MALNAVLTIKIFISKIRISKDKVTLFQTGSEEKDIFTILLKIHMSNMSDQL